MANMATTVTVATMVTVDYLDSWPRSSFISHVLFSLIFRPWFPLVHWLNFLFLSLRSLGLLPLCFYLVVKGNLNGCQCMTFCASSFVLCPSLLHPLFIISSMWKPRYTIFSSFLMLIFSHGSSSWFPWCAPFCIGLFKPFFRQFKRALFPSPLATPFPPSQSPLYRCLAFIIRFCSCCKILSFFQVGIIRFVH